MLSIVASPFCLPLVLPLEGGFILKLFFVSHMFYTFTMHLYAHKYYIALLSIYNAMQYKMYVLNCMCLLWVELCHLPSLKPEVP